MGQVSMVNEKFNYKNTGGLLSSTNSGDFVVTRYVSAIEVYIRFVGYGTEHRVRSCEVKRGTCKNPYHPSVCGVGYLGPASKAQVSFIGIPTRAYVVWSGLLDRCYNTRARVYHNYGGKGTTVCDEWLCFSNFHSWYTRQAKTLDEDFDVDKDILARGKSTNKIYSPSTCRLIPPRVNLLISSNRNVRGDYPIGVVLRKGGKYEAGCRDGSGKIVYLGRHISAELAFNEYKTYKEKVIKETALTYYALGSICKDIRDALLRWEVSIDD